MYKQNFISNFSLFCLPLQNSITQKFINNNISFNYNLLKTVFLCQFYTWTYDHTLRTILKAKF